MSTDLNTIYVNNLREMMIVEEKYPVITKSIEPH